MSENENGNGKGKRTIGEMSVDTRILYERLKKAQVNELVTYQELNDLIKRNVQGEAYFVMATARRRCMAEDMIVYGTVENEGIKRLDPAAIANSGEFFVHRIKKTARRAIKTLSCLTTDEFAGLSNEDKVKHNAYRSAVGVVEHFMKPAQVKKIEAAVTEQQTALPIMRTLEVFKSA